MHVHILCYIINYTPCNTAYVHTELIGGGYHDSVTIVHIYVDTGTMSYDGNDL